MIWQHESEISRLFFASTKLDIFNETSGRFPAVLWRHAGYFKPKHYLPQHNDMATTKARRQDIFKPSLWQQNRISLPKCQDMFVAAYLVI